MFLSSEKWKMIGKSFETEAKKNLNDGLENEISRKLGHRTIFFLDFEARIFRHC